MAGRVFFGQTSSRTVAAAFVLLVLLQSTLVWDQTTAAPARRDDILAGTEFLSVFINGAMAQTPVRRRGSRRGVAVGDHVAAESQRQEAAIYRISRTSKTSNVRPPPAKPGIISRDEGVRFYPISQKSFDNSASLTSLIDDLSTASEIGSMLTPRTGAKASGQTGEPVNQKVIGVSVTSTVEATPYKVRVEHYVGDEMTTVAKTAITKPVPTMRTTSTTPATTTCVTFVTPLPALLVTEELSNIVSESNRSEFNVDEGSPRTSWQNRARSTTQKPRGSWHTSHPLHRHHRKEMSDSVEVSETEPVEKSHEIDEHNSEVSETHKEPTEPTEHLHQGRKAGRHYETILYDQHSRSYGQSRKTYGNSARLYGEPAKVYGEPEKVYGEPAKVYSEPARMYGEPAKVYGEPSKVYSEPAKVYGEPEKIYSEPSKVYSEPSKVYSEPSKVYSEPARVYSEPAKIYGADGRPVKTPKTPNPSEEPEEENYEIDEAVSVGSNGNVHGPQMITESSGIQDSDDGQKFGYVVEGRNFRKYRVEERTPDGFIVGEYGVVSHDDGSLRGVRYTADGNINPRLIHDTLMKFLAL